jgi:hypothetical protein
MKYLNTPTLLFSLLFLFALNANAQTEDYVININGDTVKCELSLYSLGGPKYKVPDGKKEKIDIEKIKEYYHASNDLRFRAVYVDTLSKPKYMQVIESGPICLYQYAPANYSGTMGMLTTSAIQWFVSKKGDRAIALKSTSLLGSGNKQERKDTLSEMLKDKPEIYNKYVADDKFSFKQIINLVHLYNTGQPYQVPQKKPDPNAKKDDMY